jgi:hypothetical protein
MSSGSLCLLRELATVAPAKATNFMPTVIELAHLRHFPHSHYLIETVWSQMCHIAPALGKRGVKPFLEDMLTPLFTALANSEHQLVAAAAGRFVAVLSRLIGPKIFHARCTADQQGMLASSVDVQAAIAAMSVS